MKSDLSGKPMTMLDKNQYEALLHPEITPYLALLPALNLANPRACREHLALRRQTIQRPRPESIRIEELEHPSDQGPLKLRLYYPESENTLDAAILCLHGGGFIMGDHDSEYVRALAFAKAGFLVVSVDYPLAPERPYPAALLNCYEALRWLWREGAKMGVSQQKILVAGSSAGGNLALAIALKARDECGPKIAGQLLFYPVLDHRCNTPSMQRNAEAPVWSAKNCVDMWQQYLASHTPDSLAKPVRSYAAPGLTERFEGLPSTYISRCEYDPLCDEAENFAIRLRAAGIQVESILHAATVHGFDLILPTELSRKAISQSVEAALFFVADLDTRA